ncbi:hypothetical protein [Xanthovirga aplysinae]|uniref:hypothetical protein n=1 Tax=Xanthovirga aplysinae TaxID=2529853 RepID=UPI0012BBEB68|nr:hypothetical protein [Xanthovirga aplysinae]MTI33227.1 hypothetical protein [Xanthovirga aplysinae]
MKQLLILLLIMSGPIAYSQTPFLEGGGEGALNKLTYYLPGKGERTYSYDEIKGSPYLPDEFVKGNVIIHVKKKKFLLPLRYNAYSDQIEYLKNGTSMVFKNPFLISKVEFGGSTYVFKMTDGFSKDKKGSFFVQLYGSERIELLKKQQVRFIPEQVAKDSYSSNKPPKFSKVLEEFYIVFGENTPVLLSKSKKRIIGILEDKGYKVKDFIKKEKLNLKEEEGLIRLMEFCDQLQM